MKIKSILTLFQKMPLPTSIKACLKGEYDPDEMLALGVQRDSVVDALGDVRNAISTQRSATTLQVADRRLDIPSWPRPYLLPAPLCPQPIDLIMSDAWVVAKDDGQNDNLEVQVRPKSRYVQNSNFGYVIVPVNHTQVSVFYVLWSSRRYRVRCWIWYQWQSWVKDLWNFFKWPLALIALLMPPAYYAYRLLDAVFWSGGSGP